MSGTDSKKPSTGDQGENVENSDVKTRLAYLREKTSFLRDALQRINERTPVNQPRKLEVTQLFDAGKNLLAKGEKLSSDVTQVSSEEMADFTLAVDEFTQHYEEDKAGDNIENLSLSIQREIQRSKYDLDRLTNGLGFLYQDKYNAFFTPDLLKRREDLHRASETIELQLRSIMGMYKIASDKYDIRETLESAVRLGDELKNLLIAASKLDTDVAVEMMNAPEEKQAVPAKKKSEPAFEQDKRIVVSILKSRWEKIQPERVEYGAKFMDAIDYGRYAGGKIGRLANEIKMKFDESAVLFSEMDQVVNGMKKVEDPNEIRNLLKKYDRLFLDMKMRLMDIEDEKNKRVRTMMEDIQKVLQGGNEEFLTSRQDALMEGWLTILRKKDTTNEEMDEIKESFEYEIVRPLAVAKEKAAEVAVAKKAREEAEAPVAEDFYAKGDEMTRKAGERAKPIKRAAKKTTEPEPLDIPVYVDLSQINKTEIKRGVQEMLREHGVVDLEPKQILDVFSQKELDFILSAVRSDVKAKADNNRADFTRVMREAISARLLEGLDKGKRDELADAVTAQTYSLLRGAVEAEMTAEIGRQQSGAMTKSAKAGKIGRSILGNVALAAGVGVGAGLVIGSGGAAAAATAGLVAVARIANKRFKIGEKVESLYGKTIGRLFKKEKPLVDEEKILREAVEKVANKDILVGILSNQLRENSSKELMTAMSAYSTSKKDAMRQPTEENARKFELSLKGVEKEFYKNAYNYVAMQYEGEDVPEDELARMALMLTRTLSVYQRGEVTMAQAAQEAGAKAGSPEDKNWLVDKTEKILKFRSEGVGSILFGGAMAYGVTESSVIARTVSGALAGAGLGLMIEKKTRMGAQEKVVKLVGEILNKTEKKVAGKDVEFNEKELDQLKRDAAYISAQLDLGLLNKNMVLRNRAENFVVRVNKLAMESFEAPGFTIDDLLKDVSKQSTLYEKESKKTVKKLQGVFSAKNRALVYMGAGAIIGAAAGYFGTRLYDHWHTPPEAQTFEPSEHDLAHPSAARYVDYEITPVEKVTPTVAVPVTEYTMGTEHVVAGEVKHAVRSAAETEVEQAAVEHVAHGPAVEAAVGVSDKTMDVHAVYSSSIKNVPAALRDIQNATPVYLTRADQVHIDEMYNAGRYDEITDYIHNARLKGQVYEDMTTGNQYHENELSFEGGGASLAGVSAEDQEAMDLLRGEQHAPVANEAVAPPAPAEAVKPDFIDQELAKVDLSKTIANPADAEFILDKMPKRGMSANDYHEMIIVYNKAGREMAVKYMHYVETGQTARAEGIVELADTIGGGAKGGDIIDRELEKTHYTAPVSPETDYDQMVKNMPKKGTGSPVDLPKEESVTFDKPEVVQSTAHLAEPTEPPRNIDRDAEEIIGQENPGEVTEPKSPGAERAVEEAQERLKNYDVDESAAGAKKAVEEAQERLNNLDAEESAAGARKAIEEAKQRLEEKSASVVDDNPYGVDEEELQDEFDDLIGASKRHHLEQLTGDNAAEARSAYDWLATHKDNPKADALRVKFEADMLDDHKIKPSLLKSVKALQGKIGG